MILDIIVAVAIAYGFYIGFSRGLIKTVLATLSILVAIVASLKLSPILMNALDSLLNIPSGAVFILGFVLTFVIVLAGIRFIGNKATDFLKTIKINFINQIAGGMFMAFFFAVLLSYGSALLINTNLISEEQRQSSIMLPMLAPLPEVSREAVKSFKPVFKGFYDKMLETMDEINNKTKEMDSNNNPPIQETGDEDLQNG